MEYTTGSIGRTIVMRLHEDDHVYECIESVAQHEAISSGIVFIIGGVKNGGVVVGPTEQNERPLNPLVERFEDAREIAGIGTLFKNKEGIPKLHMHASIGKGRAPLVGCPRKGLDCWLVSEIIIIEMTGINAGRVPESSGLELLKVFGTQAQKEF